MRSVVNSESVGKRLMAAYEAMNDHFGNLSWWPGETAFEIALGAILTQNTNWKNVTRAIENIRNAGILQSELLYKADKDYVAELIRPAGFFNVKTTRLRAFLEYLHGNYGGDMDEMSKEETWKLRKSLLSVKGIGEETADSILLYGCRKKVFVVDAYTRRIFTRHNIIDNKWTYHDIQRLCMDNLPSDSEIYNQYHALIVETGKQYCRKKQQCTGCPLARGENNELL